MKNYLLEIVLVISMIKCVNGQTNCKVKSDYFPFSKLHFKFLYFNGWTGLQWKLSKEREIQLSFIYMAPNKNSGMSAHIH